MSISTRLSVARGAFGQFAEEGHGYITFPKLEGRIGPRMMFRGREKIVWSLNDYLGLARHPEVLRVDAEAAAQYALSFPMGSRIMSGNLEEHENLETKLAQFVNKEAAILLNYGYQGVFSCIDALLSRKDVVIYDEECHACILDGIRLHLGKHMAYRHNDVLHLRERLEKALTIKEKTGGEILVISEGVFSMRGDQGKLREIVSLKKAYPFELFVDDAHGFGVLGRTGAGTGEAQGIQDQIDFYFATFAKSMASIGAFLAARKNVVHYLAYNARSQVFAKALPIVITIGALKRLELIRSQPEIRTKLWENARALRTGLIEAGLSVGPGESPITPVYLQGSMESARMVLMDLRDTHDIFCSGVIYPVVPKGVILFRLVATANHTRKDIKDTVEAFRKVNKEMVQGKYQSAGLVRSKSP